MSSSITSRRVRSFSGHLSSVRGPCSRVRHGKHNLRSTIEAHILPRAQKHTGSVGERFPIGICADENSRYRSGLDGKVPLPGYDRARGRSGVTGRCIGAGLLGENREAGKNNHCNYESLGGFHRKISLGSLWSVIVPTSWGRGKDNGRDNACRAPKIPTPCKLQLLNQLEAGNWRTGCFPEQFRGAT